MLDTAKKWDSIMSLKFVQKSCASESESELTLIEFMVDGLLNGWVGYLMDELFSFVGRCLRILNYL
jgi:hypothetical protein